MGVLSSHYAILPTLMLIKLNKIKANKLKPVTVAFITPFLHLSTD